MKTYLSFKTYTYTGVSTGSPLRGGQRLNTASEDARRRAVAEFERWRRRAVSNIDSLKLFATLKEAYPVICMIQKCLLACPPSQSDCEELFSLLALYQGIFMYVEHVEHSEVADSVDTRACPQMTTDIDGLRYSPDDPYYGLGPVHTSLYVRVA